MSETNTHKTRGNEMTKAKYIGNGLRFMTIDKIYTVLEVHKTYAMVIADDNEAVFLIIEDLEFI